MSNPIRCPQGHFYDPDKYAQCPHCGGATAGAPAGVTVPMTPPAGGMPMGANNPILTPNTPPVFGGETVSIGMATAGFAEKEDERTMAFYDTSKGFEKDVNPVVGWLVCTKGPERGRDYRLHAGRNFVGRSWKMDVCIVEDRSISRENHASLVFDPKSCIFSLVPGDSVDTCLNGEELTAPQPLLEGDRITLGQSEFDFVPYCKGEVTWE